MKYKALISFSGVLSMKIGEIKEISDDNIVKDLVKAGYIEEVSSLAEKPIVEEKKEVAKAITPKKATPTKKSTTTKKATTNKKTTTKKK